MAKDELYVEVSQPSIRCGACGFQSGAHGTWSRIGGRLVWTSEAVIQPCRGPDLYWCSECQARFTKVELDAVNGWVTWPPDPVSVDPYDGEPVDGPPAEPPASGTLA